MNEYSVSTIQKVYIRCTPSSLAYTYVRKVYTYARFFALKVYTKVYTFLRDLRSTFRVNYTYSLGPLEGPANETFTSLSPRVKTVGPKNSRQSWMNRKCAPARRLFFFIHPLAGAKMAMPARRRICC